MKDFSQLAFDVVQRATKELKNPTLKDIKSITIQELVKRAKKPQDYWNEAAVALGSKGGKKGGPARAKALSRAKRIAIAKKAARARWKKKKISIA